MSDLVFLFTSSGPDWEAIDRYKLGTICSQSCTVVWTQGLSSYTISHEIAHALNAPHTNGRGIMGRNRDQYGPRYFDESTLKTMETFIATEGDCLAPYSGKTPIIFPVDLTKTCESGFGGMHPQTRDWLHVKHIRFGFSGSSADVTVYYYQSSRQMYIYRWADSGHSIEKYRRMVAMGKLRKKKIGEWISPL